MSIHPKILWKNFLLDFRIGSIIKNVPIFSGDVLCKLALIIGIQGADGRQSGSKSDASGLPGRLMGEFPFTFFTM